MPDPERKEGERALQWRPEDVSIPSEVEKKEKVSSRQSQFKAQVYDDSGKPLIATPQTKTVTVQLPADQKTLATLSKGKVSESISWLATFWLRMVKKAAHFGWRVLKRGEE